MEEEKTWLRVGTCIYCGKKYTKNYKTKNVPQRDVDHMAVSRCDCADATAIREETEELKRRLIADGKPELARKIG